MNVEDEVIELTVENQSLNNQIQAYSRILDELLPTLTNQQRARLSKMYAHERQQLLNNFDLDEEQTEELEALVDLLEQYLDV